MLNRIALIMVLTLIGFGAENVKFDSVPPGKLPPGWTVAKSMKWEVRGDRSAPSRPNVLESAGDAEDPVAVFDKVICNDGELSVKFRISDNRGRAGIVWRYQDPGNYYLLNLSPDGRHVEFMRVRNGKAEVLPNSAERRPESIAINPGQWHIVKVVFRGAKLDVYFGNRTLFSAQDTSLATAGRTGLWARGAGVSFDDFRIDKKR